MLPCAFRETSWLAGSTTTAKAAVSDKKAVSNSDCSEIQAYSSLVALLKCKLQFYKWIGDFQSLQPAAKWDSQGESCTDAHPVRYVGPTGRAKGTVTQQSSAFRDAAVEDAFGQRCQSFSPFPAPSKSLREGRDAGDPENNFLSEKKSNRSKLISATLSPAWKNLPVIMSQSPLKNKLAYHFGKVHFSTKWIRILASCIYIYISLADA